MSGNGVDLGQVVSMLHSLIQTIADMRSEFTARFDEQGRILDEHTRTLAEHSRILAEHSRVLAEHTRTLAEHSLQFGEVRKEIAFYHASVTGHGILITELDTRLRRVEEHLNLPTAA